MNTSKWLDELLGDKSSWREQATLRTAYCCYAVASACITTLHFYLSNCSSYNGNSYDMMIMSKINEAKYNFKQLISLQIFFSNRTDNLQVDQFVFCYLRLYSEFNYCRQKLFAIQNVTQLCKMLTSHRLFRQINVLLYTKDIEKL